MNLEGTLQREGSQAERQTLHDLTYVGRTTDSEAQSSTAVARPEDEGHQAAVMPDRSSGPLADGHVTTPNNTALCA